MKSIWPKKVDRPGRDIQIIGVRLVGIVRRYKVRKYRQQVQQQDQPATDEGHLVLAKLPPHQLRLRGNIDLFLGRARVHDLFFALSAGSS